MERKTLKTFANVSKFFLESISQPLSSLIMGEVLNYQEEADYKTALEKAENRFEENYPNFLGQPLLNIDNSELLADSIKEYFQHPNEPHNFKKMLMTLLVNDLKNQRPYELVEVRVDFYIKALTDELAQVDDAFRGRAGFFITSSIHENVINIKEDMNDIKKFIFKFEDETKKNIQPAVDISIFATKPSEKIDIKKFFNREMKSKEILEALSQNNLIVITGNGGAGKSALAAKIYYQIGEREILTNIKRMTWINCEELNDQSQLLIESQLSHLLDSNTSKGRWNDQTISLPERYRALFEEFEKEEYLVCFDNLESFQDKNGRLVNENFLLFFQALFQNRRNKLHVIVTTQTSPQFDIDQNADLTLVTLPGLPPEEAVKLLKSFFTKSLTTQENLKLEAIIETKLHGNPLYVKRLAAWMKTHSIIKDSDKYFTDPDQIQKELIGKPLERRNLAQKLVLTALSIFERPETEDAIEFLIKGYPTTNSGKALIELAWDGFLLEGERISAIDGVQKQVKTFGIHGFDRAYIQQNWMLDENYLSKEQFHQHAAEYYDEQVSQYQPTKYKNWYRLEDQDWQKDFLEWLSQLRLSNNLPAAQLSIATKYFNAFWWWGCYLEFPFCEQLINFTTKTTGFNNDPVVKLLAEFHEICPRERSYKKLDTENWQKTKDLLLKLRQELGCNGTLNELQADEVNGAKKLYLRAALDAYLGDAFYSVDGRKAALSFYKTAITVACDFLKDSDWIASYLLCYRADRHIADGDYKNGRKDISTAWGLADKNDREIKTRYFRLLGDIYWGEKQYEHAWKAYQLTIFYAYQFQGESENHKPDPYTALFYDEMLERIIDDRLEEWYSLDPSSSISACQTMRSFWKHYWSDTEKEEIALDNWLSNEKWTEIKAYLFPEIPQTDTKTSEADKERYAEYSRSVTKKMSRAVGKLYSELGIQK